MKKILKSMKLNSISLPLKIWDMEFVFFFSFLSLEQDKVVNTYLCEPPNIADIAICQSNCGDIQPTRTEHETTAISHYSTYLRC